MIIGVLGANGFLGRSLCLRYLQAGHKVVAIYHENKSLIPLKCSTYSISSLPETHLNCLIIAIGGHSLAYDDYLKQYAVLEKVTKQLTFDKIIFISSVEVFGKGENVIKFNSPFNQPGVYGLSKLSQEFIINSFKNSVIIRPTYLYGQGMLANSLIPKWVASARNNYEIIVYGSGDREQDYLYIDDLTDLCLTAATNSVTGTFIAASGKSISNSDLAVKIAAHFPQTSIKHLGDDLTSSSRFDVSETIQAFNWRAQIGIDTGLEKFIKNESSYL